MFKILQNKKKTKTKTFLSKMWKKRNSSIRDSFSRKISCVFFYEKKNYDFLIIDYFLLRYILLLLLLLLFLLPLAFLFCNNILKDRLKLKIDTKSIAVESHSKHFCYPQQVCFFFLYRKKKQSQDFYLSKAHRFSLV